MSRVCPKCGREYFGQTVKCIHCNIPLAEKSISQTAQQTRGKTAQHTRRTAAQINYQRVKQEREEQEKIRQQQQLLLLEQEQKKENKNKQVNSTLGILALVFSILGCTFWIGIILAIIDLCQKNGKKKTLSIISVVVCFLWLIIGISANSVSDSGKSTRSTSGSSVSSDKRSDSSGTYEDSETTATDTNKEKKSTSTQSFVYDDLSVSFVESKVENDYAGDECLVLYFDFTNNSDENKAFVYEFTVDAFQNGVELDSSYFHVNDETKNKDREIQPGTSIRVGVSFGIGDDRSIVDVEVKPWISFSNETLANFKVNF